MMDEKEKDVLQNEAAEQEKNESTVQEVKEAEPQQTDEAQEPKEAEGDTKEKAAAAANEAKEKAAQAADKAVDKAKELAAKTDALPKKKKMILGAVVVVVILLLIKGLAGGSPFDRIASDMLKQYPFADNARAEDGSYLKLDTNPYDKDVDDMDYVQLSTFYDIQSDTLEGIKYVNKELGFSDAVWQKMMQTTSLMGRQSDENEKYRVSWSYHPDHGLEVMYEKK